MTTYQFEIPRAVSIFYLIFGIIFGVIWIQLTLPFGNVSFVLLGVLIIIAFIGVSIYMLITGRSPLRIRTTGKLPFKLAQSK